MEPFTVDFEPEAGSREQQDRLTAALSTGWLNYAPQEEPVRIRIGRRGGKWVVAGCRATGPTFDPPACRDAVHRLLEDLRASRSPADIGEE